MMSDFLRFVTLALLACGPWAAPAAAAGASVELTPVAATGSEQASVARLWQPGDAGTRLHLQGRILDTLGRAVEGASIQLWQADGTGVYQSDRYRAQLTSGANGAFSVSTVLPGQYYGAKHIHLVITHDAYPPLRTRVLFKGDPFIDAGEEDFAILLEEVHRDGETVLVGTVELTLRPPGAN